MYLKHVFINRQLSLITSYKAIKAPITIHCSF